jgi:hypothetical protein
MRGYTQLLIVERRAKHYSPNGADKGYKMVPREGFEPSRLSSVDFKSTVYAVPPPGRK